MKTNNSFNMNHLDSSKYNKMIQKLATQVSQKDLRTDIADWIETVSGIDASASCFVLTVVQRPGAREQQIFPQEYKSVKSAKQNCTRVLAEIIADCGAQCATTDIRNDRFYVTTENNVKITMVLE